MGEYVFVGFLDPFKGRFSIYLPLFYIQEDLQYGDVNPNWAEGGQKVPSAF